MTAKHDTKVTSKPLRTDKETTLIHYTMKREKSNNPLKKIFAKLRIGCSTSVDENVKTEEEAKSHGVKREADCNLTNTDVSFIQPDELVTNLDTCNLTDEDFDEIHRYGVMFKIPKAMVSTLTSEELDAIIEGIQKNKQFDNKSKTIYVATGALAREQVWETRGLSLGTCRRRCSREVTSSDSTSSNSEIMKPCRLKLRRQDRKSLDILHDCACYSQYNMPGPSGFRSRAEAVNEFLNTITNDIVDENKEPIPKDPMHRPALGAAGMYPTKKWLAELKRRGIKPEPNKHYRVLGARNRHRAKHYQDEAYTGVSIRSRQYDEKLKEMRKSAEPRARSLRRDNDRVKKRLIESKPRSGMRSLAGLRLKSRQKSVSTDTSTE